MSEASQPQGSVVTREAARAALLQLRKHKIHRFFAGYLCILKTAAETNRDVDLEVRFKQFFDEFLTLGDPPSNKPYVVPFSQSESSTALLFNRNVAGSYAPKSLRPNQPFTNVITVQGGGPRALYSLKQGHATLALNNLLFGVKAPAAALSIFLYRDYALSGFPLTATDFVSEFRQKFGFDQSDSHKADFDTLFETDTSFLEGIPVVEAAPADAGSI